MANPINMDVYATRLLDTDVDNAVKVAIANELRESVEILQSVEYPRFLTLLLPAFTTLLSTVEVSCDPRSNEHKLRNTILELIHRFPHNEALKGFLPDIMKSLMDVLRQDNEENGVLCLKVMIDLHKSYKPIMEDYVQPFLDIVQEMFRNMPDAVNLYFNFNENPQVVVDDASTEKTSLPENPADVASKKILPKSMMSFKSLTECPVIIATLFSLHRKFVSSNVPAFVPCTVNTITLQPAAQQRAHDNAASTNTIFFGMSPDVIHSQIYIELKSLQVKTLSFIAYLAKTFLPLLKPYQEKIAEGTISLLKDLPSDASVTRKELLVAIRHLFYFDLRGAFVKYLDLLITDEVLVGTGITAREILRPLAHSFLVDLIHHLRNELSISQMGRIIHTYSRNLHNPTFAPHMQTMSCKLLLSLIDNIVAQPDKKEARKLLIQVLDAFSRRLTSLHEIFPSVCEYRRHKKTSTKPEDENYSQSQQVFGFIDIGTVQPIRTIMRPFDGSPDLMRDMRIQLKTVLLGIKTTLFAMGNSSNLALDISKGTDGEEKVDLSSHALEMEEEVNIFVRIFKDGLHCFEYFGLDEQATTAEDIQKDSTESNMASSSTSSIGPGASTSVPSKEDKEAIELFASLFTFCEPWMFQEIISTHLELLYDSCVANPSLHVMPQFFLGNVNISSNFIGLLLQFLIDRLEELGSEDSSRSSAMLRFFKLVFMAVTLFPDTNEVILRPHLAKIITTSLKLSSTTASPINYFYLLRTLFRSIGGGRFELLYQEVLPLLQILLETLNSLITSTTKIEMKELYVELCLTVPVRLSVLLPYLSYLMRPLVIALQAGPDLVSQSLRTLELCVDNLNPDFLEPIFSPVMDELMKALWKHLKPLPYNSNHATTALRILGKFGGRNRRVLEECSKLHHFKSEEMNSIEMNIQFFGSDQKQSLSLQGCLETAINLLQSSESLVHTKRHAFNFAKNILPLVFAEPTQSELERLPAVVASTITNCNLALRNPDETSEKFSFPNADSQLLPRDRKATLDLVLAQILICHFEALQVQELKEEAQSALDAFGNYFALVAVVETGNAITSGSLRKPVLSFGLDSLNSIFVTSQLCGVVDALAHLISCEDTSKRENVENFIMMFYEKCKALLPTDGLFLLEDLVVFHILVSRFASCCYQPEWFKKVGGCVGLGTVLKKVTFSPEWVSCHQLEIVKALLFVLKDGTMNLSYFSASHATSTLDHIIRVCNDPAVMQSLPENETRQASLVTLLFQELSNSNQVVREAVQAAFDTLATLSGSNVTTLLTPTKDKLLASIFSKPLRALPLPLQMGHIDAITYCLALSPPLVTFNDELLRLLHEALAIADAEDQALVSKTAQFKSASSLVSLRVLCIKLLSAAYGYPDLGAQRHVTTRNRMLSVFFKCLYFRNTEVVEAANEALHQVLTLQHKLPKELLHSTLRPILVNLGDYKKLSVSGMEGLARLMKLLTNYFKVEIGRKLLDHVRSIADPSVLKKAAGKPLMEVEEVKIVVSILDVFHLLPAAANVFLDDIVTQILEMESRLCRVQSSPFRLPLLRFLDRFHADGIQYFSSHLASSSHTFLLIGILNLKQDSVFREEWIKSSPMWIKLSLEPEDLESSGRLALHFLHLFKCHINLDNQWLVQNLSFIGPAMINLWRNRTNGPLSQIQFNQIFTLVLEVLIQIYKQDLTNIDLLFSITEGILDSSIMDTGFIKRFIYETVCKSLSAELRRELIRQYLVLFPQDQYTPWEKACLLRYLISPAIVLYDRDVREIIDVEVVDAIHTHIWTSNALDQATDGSDIDVLKVEILQLGSFLLDAVPDLINESRKDIIKFAWNLLKSEDMVVKQSANVLLSRFICQYETPSKIVMQFYVALLRTHQPESRTLVRQALDTVVPVLPHRIGQPASENAKIPLWIQWIRKIMIEEGHILPQSVSLFQLLIRNPDTFYSSREHFILQIVSALPKLGLTGHATPESRLLTVDLCKLIFNWEKKARSENSKAELTQEDVEMVTEDSKVEDATMDWSSSPNIDYREMVVNYLFRFCLSLTDQPANTILPKIMDVLRDYLSLWADIPIKLNQIEKVLGVDAESNLTLILHSVELLQLCWEFKSHSWILGQFSFLQKCFEAWTPINNETIMKSFVKIVAQASKARDEVGGFSGEDDDTRPSEEISFFKAVDNYVTSNLKTNSNVDYSVSLLLGQYENRIDHPEKMVPLRTHIPELTRHLTVLTKDLAAQTPSDSDKETIRALIILLNSQILYMAEQRKPFLSAITSILDAAELGTIHELILNLVHGWVFGNSNEAFPTIKEKASIALKMVVLEKYNNPSLFKRYMEFVADIYQTPKFAASELAIKLEAAFLQGTTSSDPVVRKKFLDIFHVSLRPDIQTRLRYIIGVQSWQSLSKSFWLQQALFLLFGSIQSSMKMGDCVVQTQARLNCPANDASNTDNDTSMDISEDDGLSLLVNQYGRDFSILYQSSSPDSILEAIEVFVYENIDFSYSLWVRMFPLFWNTLNPQERHDCIKESIGLLSQEYHLDQAGNRPNVIQAILEGYASCGVQLPPHLLKFLGKTFDAWHTALEMLQRSLTDVKPGFIIATKEDYKIREIVQDALCDMYSSLSEHDYFYGLWRKKSLFAETNAAVTAEQHGLYHQAQNLYEMAQAKARTGVLPFTEYEYCLWEDHWRECAKRLQQWDLLTDLAKNTGDAELLLECAWRLSDWNAERDSLAVTLSSLTQPSNLTPGRKKMFEAYTILQRAAESADVANEFQQHWEDGVQLILQQWYSLPSLIGNSHIPTFHAFQQYVELQEAWQIQSILVNTNITTIDNRSQELKHHLTTWRERLPNSWDDIDLWSDLVSWRQHVFASINQAYLPLIPQLTQAGGAGTPTSSYAYRGFHEIAWIINRFSHVARKRNLPDVCVSALSKIYTLPNIEIQEAFYKLREQAKCHLRTPDEYSTGLDVINNTNLQYFSLSQKAEFFALKGQFLSKLALQEETLQAFSSAIQIDFNLAKGWAAWGEYNDQLFSVNSAELRYAVDAVNCYLHAAGAYNSARSRKYLARILWLLSFDDESGSLTKVYESYKSDVPVWYWVTFIPNLIHSLSGKESSFARLILMKIAKTYPQALQFPLRTAKEELFAMRKQQLARSAAAQASTASTATSSASASTGNNAPSSSASTTSQVASSQDSHAEGEKPVATSDVAEKEDISTAVSQTASDQPKSSEDADMTDALAPGESSAETESTAQQNPNNGNESSSQSTAAVKSPAVEGAQSSQSSASNAGAPKQPLELIDEIMGTIKTSFPLLTLSLETMVEHIIQRLKPTTDEDIYRLISALLNDGIQMYMTAVMKDPKDGGKLSAATEANLLRFAASMEPNHIKYKKLFEDAFITSNPTLAELVERFTLWRDSLELILDNRPTTQYLEQFSHYLAEFEYQKFDEVEVPGQYLEFKNNNKEFARITRFDPIVKTLRKHASCHRALTIHGHDGSHHPFILQHPAPKLCRRDERMVHIFRLFNNVLSRKRESRRRNLHFTVPGIVPFSPQIRLVQNESSYISLHEVWEDYCKREGIPKDRPVTYFMKRMKEACETFDMTKRMRLEFLNLKAEIMDDIASKYIPNTILSSYVSRKMKSSMDLWTLRKRFTASWASNIFMTYIMSIGNRIPSKIHISFDSGNVWFSDLLANVSNMSGLLSNTESIPFRLTPNIQEFMTPAGVEGVLTGSLIAIGRSLSAPEFRMEDYLHIYIRDELMTWQLTSRKPIPSPAQFREQVIQNAEVVSKRAQALSCQIEREQGPEALEPINQTLLDLISQAVNPLKLAQMDISYMSPF